MISSEKWICLRPESLPDFIIVGAMKSATSSLHNILNSHPSIFIPDEEIGFFDIDNVLQHPDFNFFSRKEWFSPLLEKEESLLWDWYFEKFSGASSNQIMGEDSTSYLASFNAIKRISEQKKDIKLIVMLRQPTMRAYSQYLHHLRTGRAAYSFEDTIKYEPYSVLERSLYRKQMENIYRFFPKERVHLILFEDFVGNEEYEVVKVSKFLDVDFDLFDKLKFSEVKNSARISMFPRVQFLKNRIHRSFGNNRYFNRLPISNAMKSYMIQKTFSVVIQGVHLFINPKLRRVKPKINPNTKLFLDEYFKRELNGLDEIINKDTFKRWFD